MPETFPSSKETTALRAAGGAIVTTILTGPEPLRAVDLSDRSVRFGLLLKAAYDYS